MLTQIMYELRRREESTEAVVPSRTSGATTDITQQRPPPKIKSPRGFIDFARRAEPYRPARERARDWDEINLPTDKRDGVELKRQAARCMDCGTPFCQAGAHTGCPINNLIPEWNELVLTDQWREAIDRLHKTNNFPEFTGRVCPAPCEGACVAGVNDPKEAVTIKNVEFAIVDKAFAEGWIVPRPVERRTGRRVAVIGSGPAGLAAADQLNQKGHSVTVFERNDRIGGLLMYGIPTMKLSKDRVDRRVALLAAEGIEFKTNQYVRSRTELVGYDAVVLATGATKPRDLPIPGRGLQGVYFAMDFLVRNQKDLRPNNKGQLRNIWGDDVVSVTGKNVVVIGGGDTGTDCIGTSMRQFCKSLVNLELQARPPDKRDDVRNPWPAWPRIFRTDYGHAEAAEIFGADPRRFATLTKRFLPDVSKTRVRALQVCSVDQANNFAPVPNTDREIPADIVILALGFVGPEDDIMRGGFGVELTTAGNIKAEFLEHATSVKGIFAAGDCRRGQSLVVWGIREGREVAERVDGFLARGERMALPEFGTAN